MVFCQTQSALAASIEPPALFKPIVSLQKSKMLLNAAEKIAQARGWPCSIVIVDDGGWPILSARMDGAPVVAGIELARGKARTSALFKRPSGDLENAINNGRQASITAGMVMMKGGQPIIINNQIVGAIGISADTPSHDDEIAITALREFYIQNSVLSTPSSAHLR
ncbi:heme-binding protein [Pseudomonas moorei]|nr:heme-binding protein [Pseudomonas moorei]